MSRSRSHGGGAGGIVGLALALVIFVDFIGVVVAVGLIVLLIVLIVRWDRKRRALPPEEYRNALTPGLVAVWSCPVNKVGHWTLQGEYPPDVIESTYQLDRTLIPYPGLIRQAGHFYAIGRDPRVRS